MVDVDGKGKVWVTTTVGALRFDPELKQFTDFKSPTLFNSDGSASPYGLAADGQGNAWWAEMSIDIVGHSNVETGKSSEIKLPPVPNQMESSRQTGRAKNVWNGRKRVSFRGALGAGASPSKCR